MLTSIVMAARLLRPICYDNFYEASRGVTRITEAHEQVDLCMMSCRLILSLGTTSEQDMKVDNLVMEGTIIVEGQYIQVLTKEAAIKGDYYDSLYSSHAT